MKYKNIVVSGDVGTGTTTLAQNLALKLGWKAASAGDFFRTYSLKHKIPLWNKAAVEDDFERQVDNELVRKLNKEVGWVIDSHYAAWFLKDNKAVFKILLTCNREVATKRILGRSHTHSETSQEIEKRRAGLYEKFKKLYSNENYEDPKYYNLVIDTTKSTVEETLEIALKGLDL